jgi:hypothetical protein
MVPRSAASIRRPPARAGAGFCLWAASVPRTTVKGIFYPLKFYRGAPKPFQSSKDKDSTSLKTNGQPSSKTGAKKLKKPSENPMSKEYYTDAHSNEILKTNLMLPSTKNNYLKNESLPINNSTTLQQKNRKYL